MSYGSHWEWRGFGGVSARFVRTYASLETCIELHSVHDRYIWIPGLEVNAKFREGVENGLKFKRPEKKEGDFEVWTENEDELFEFPLSDNAWKTLQTILQNTALNLPDPPPSFTQEHTEQWLEQAGCKIVEVQKERESKLLEVKCGSVLVEWTSISEPQSLISIGLENYSESEAEQLTSETDKQILELAVKEMGLHDEPLRPVNYMGAVKEWARGNKI